MVAKKSSKVLVLRTCAADMTAYGGFVWPRRGVVKAPDWSPEPVCGKGLHGLLHGEGDGNLLSWEPNAKWLVIEVDEKRVVDLGSKVKFPSGKVVFCGDRLGATGYIAEHDPGHAVVCGTATAGNRGTATAGECGTATAGDGGILNLRWWDGDRYRIATFYVGEGGIEPNVKYGVDGRGKAVRR